MCDLVEHRVGDNSRNRHHAIHLKGLAAERHTGVVTNTGYEIYDRDVPRSRRRVAEIDGGGAVERDRASRA